MTLTKTKVSIGIIACAVIAAMSPITLLPNIGVPYIDKVAHICANCVIALLLSQYISIRKSILITFLVFTGIEFYQAFLPYRQASLGDMLANTIGVVGAWALYKIRLTFFSK